MSDLVHRWVALYGALGLGAALSYARWAVGLGLRDHWATAVTALVVGAVWPLSLLVLGLNVLMDQHDRRRRK